MIELLQMIVLIGPVIILVYGLVTPDDTRGGFGD